MQKDTRKLSIFMEAFLKKILIALFVFFSISHCFAKGQRDSLEVGIGYHNAMESQNNLGSKDQRKMPSYAINLTGVTFNTEKTGFGAYANFLFPQKITMTEMGQSFTVDRSDYDFLFGVDLLFGPVIMLYKGDSFCLPLSAGIHYMHLWANAPGGNSNTNSMGIGANLASEYHFNKTIYVYGRFQLSFDFYTWGKTEIDTEHGSKKESVSDSSATWGIQPCIGIGFTF